MKKLLMIAVYVMAYSLATAQTVVPDTTQSVRKATKGTICKGTTKAGQQCKKVTRDLSGYCFMHKPKEGREVKK